MVEIESCFFNFQSQPLITIASGAIPRVLHLMRFLLSSIKLCAVCTVTVEFDNEQTMHCFFHF